MGSEGDSIASEGAEAKVICGAKTGTKKLAFQVGWQEELRSPRGVTRNFTVLRDRVIAPPLNSSKEPRILFVSQVAVVLCSRPNLITPLKIDS